MKDTFSEYYQLSKEEIDKHWENDVFCFDANVLLNLYRYTPTTRKVFFSVLVALKDRIWIPYQAAHEYQSNRLSVISAQQKAYDDIRGLLKSKNGEIEAQLNQYKRHPYLETEELKKQINSAFASISQDLDDLEKKHPDLLDFDPIWDELTEVLEGKVGEDFKGEELKLLYADGKARYEQQVPPGYMDLKTKKNEQKRRLYGDLILWKQVIEEAKNLDHSIILVTDDLKEDWWYRFKGQTIGPRVELIKEFKQATQKRVNIYQADRFLELAIKKLKQPENKEAVQEIRAIRRADLSALAQKLQEEIEQQEEELKRLASTTKKSKSAFEMAIQETIEGKEKDKK